MRSDSLVTADGARLALRVFEPEGGGCGSVVIGAAMGVRQEFYAPFAQWLAEQGWRVTTFDYRGCGDSKPEGRSLRGFRADLFDWARDYESVVACAHAALPDRPLYLLGHSLGAQLPGLIRNQEQVSGMLCVAGGSGYWRDTAPGVRRSAPFFWFVLVPLATAVFGYFPGRSLGLIGDIPARAMMQWRRWCLSARYSVGAEGEPVRRRYAGVRFPIHALSITDDEMMTLRGIHSLVNLYENAPRQVRELAPAELGERRIGHFGAFRSEYRSTLWPRLEQWLRGLAPAQPS